MTSAFNDHPDLPEEDYVVLRYRKNEPSQSIKSIYGEPFSSTTIDEQGIVAERIRLSPSKCESICREKDVVGAAPKIPLHLVPPVRKNAESPFTAGENGLWGLDATGASRTRLTGSGTIVAILDTGIAVEHPAFDHVRERIVQENFTDEESEDLDGHGTHCAGSLFGGVVDGVRLGVAPGIERALVAKVLGKHRTDSECLHRALLWAMAQGANIISMSLGFDFHGYEQGLISQNVPPDVAFSRALNAYEQNLDLFAALGHLVTAKRDQTTLLIAAGGNQSRRKERQDYVVNRGLPSAAAGFLSVGALMQAGSRLAVAPYSNSGVRICVPGEDILSASPGNGLIRLSGTSMATAYVSGIAALWHEQLTNSYGSISSQLLSDKLIGSAASHGIDRATASDIGAGMVLAPTV